MTNETTPLNGNAGKIPLYRNVFFLSTLRVLAQNLWYLTWAIGPESILPPLRHQLSHTEYVTYRSFGVAGFVLDMIILYAAKTNLNQRSETSVDIENPLNTHTPRTATSKNINKAITKEELDMFQMQRAYTLCRPIVAILYFSFKETALFTAITFDLLAIFSLAAAAINFKISRAQRLDVSDADDDQGQAQGQGQGQAQAQGQGQGQGQAQAQVDNFRSLVNAVPTVNLITSTVSLVATVVWPFFPGYCGAEFILLNFAQLTYSYWSANKIATEKDRLVNYNILAV